MSKGIYTQGVAVLFETAPTLDELAKLLKGFKVTGRLPAAESWALGGASLLLEYRPEVNGRVQVDIVNQPWPDAMGSLAEDPELLAAWTRGCFGPFCFPGSLERARQHCYTWAEGSDIAGSHGAFVRIRFSYAETANVPNADTPVLPRGYDPAEECALMLDVAEAVLEHPRALAYFNPNGEVLHPLKGFAEVCEHYRKASMPPVNLLANRRMVKFEGTDWMMMDLLGLDQLDLTDLEVCFTDRYDPNEMAVFLVNTALHIIKTDPVLKEGHTMGGPKGALLEIRGFDEPLMTPPREVLRFRPRDGTISPTEMGFGDKPFGKSAWWQFWKL